MIFINTVDEIIALCDKFDIKYVPYDTYGRKFLTTISTKDNSINKRNIFIQTALFLKHAAALDLSLEKNMEESDKIINSLI